MAMKFELVYPQKGWDRLDGSGNPVENIEKPKGYLVNENGNAGLVTLWTPVGEVRRRIQDKLPELLKPDSPLVAMTSLYGNGLQEMLANLAHNPQIDRIAVTGSDLKPVMSSEGIINFFKEGVDEVLIGDVPFLGVRGTSYVVDSQLRPDIFRPDFKVEKFDISDLESIAGFVGRKGSEYIGERRKIELKKPEFNDFPSDIFNHNIVEETPLEAWMEVLYRIDRFGVNIDLPKGKRRALGNLDVNILNPGFEQKDKLKKFGFNPEKLKLYGKELLSAEIPGDQPYGYGNRLRAHFGGDALNKIADMLKEDPLNRYTFTSVWDTKHDLLERNANPCFTGAYFVSFDGKELAMSADFRTHNVVEAWLTNLYGMRAVQEYVADKAGMSPGQINIRSRWIGMDSSNSGTSSALELVKQHRKKRLNVTDPRGYFVVEAIDGEIVARHHHSNGIALREYVGKDAMSIKNQLRQDSAVSDPDHSMWIGHELARVEQELYGKIEDF